MEPSDLLTIGEVAERAGLATSAIRYYEERGLVSATRTSGGQRRFARAVIRRLAFIIAAQRVGRSLDEIVELLGDLPEDRTPDGHDWERVASSWRPRLDQQIAQLVALRDQLDSCIGCGCLSITKCAIYNPNDRAATLGAGARYLLGDTANDIADDTEKADGGTLTT